MESKWFLVDNFIITIVFEFFAYLEAFEASEKVFDLMLPKPEEFRLTVSLKLNRLWNVDLGRPRAS